MKLLKLSSSNPKFKTIKFNDGMNIVAGLQTSSSSTRTCNGIGKSSTLQLIHLMLGAQLDVKKHASDARLHKFLSSYGLFILDLKVGTVPYKIEINFADGDYYLDGVKQGKSGTFKKKISEKILSDSNLDASFKQVLNCFARRYLPGRNYYADPLFQQGQRMEDFNQRIANLSLLKLDTALPRQFKVVQDDLSRIAAVASSLKKANLTENESELQDLEDKLEALVLDKKNFVIAQNYDELKREADGYTEVMNTLRNQIFRIERNLRNKARTLEESKQVQTVDLDLVGQIFNEANFHFSDSIEKRLEEAQDFHIKIHTSRRKRLQDQVADLNEQLAGLITQLGSQESMRDSILKDLDAQGALEEFNSIVEHIRTTEQKIAELSSYQKAAAQIEKDRIALESEKGKINLQAIEYIESKQDHIQHVKQLFRALVRRFYDAHGGAIRIQKNMGEAKYLFDIETYIQKDGSEGVGEVKIFCYDMLLFELNSDLLGFVAHDSTLFNGVDLRQIKMMFKITLEMCEQHNLQYFVNINKDVYEQLIDTEDDDVLDLKDKRSLVEGTVLELFDDKPEHTLFGQYFG
ncbi:DUF2326 domain-containing protein [Vibrio splendidus]